MFILDVLFFAWILSWFDMDEILVRAVNEIFGKNYSTDVYWLVAFVIGVILSIIELL